MCYNILPSWVFATFKLNIARNLILVFEPICLRSNFTESALLCSPFESLLDIHCIEFFVPYEKESYHSLLFMNVEWKCCLLERDGLEGITFHRLDMNARYCIFITAVKQLCGTTLFIKLLWYKLKSAFFKHFQKKTIIIFEINFLKYVDFSWACSYCFLSMNLFIEVCYPIKQVHCELLSWLLLTFEGMIFYSFVFYKQFVSYKKQIWHECYNIFKQLGVSCGVNVLL